jgi:hypothetical protein
MTDEELNQRFAQLAEAVTRIADAGFAGMGELSSGIQELRQTLDRFITVATTRFAQQDDRIRQLIDGQLATQQLSPDLSSEIIGLLQQHLNRDPSDGEILRVLWQILQAQK